jgi:hypothetical protein
MHKGNAGYADFRELFETIEYYDGAFIYRDTFIPWLRDNVRSRGYGSTLSREPGNPIPAMPV